MKNKLIRIAISLGIAFICNTASAAQNTSGLPTVLRQYERMVTLAPGEQTNIAAVCLNGETVIGGGPTGIPAGPTIVYSSLFFDGVRSGWAVQYTNNTTSTLTVTPRTGAICTKGTMTLGTFQ